MKAIRPRFIGMRCWLGLAFAAVAALTAIAVVGLLNARSQQAFERDGKVFAFGNSAMAADALRDDTTSAAIARHAIAISKQQRLAIFVFDRRGTLISSPTSFGLRWHDVPGGEEALSSALKGFRYLEGRKDGSAYTVGLTLHQGAGAALVAYSLRPEIRAQLGVVRNEYLQAALIAFGVGAALGLLIATLTARRLARIARAASEIGDGNFGVGVSSNFPDEVGSLALSIERMRTRLESLFRTLEGDRDRLERLLDRLDEGVLVVNRELEVEFANDSARALLGEGSRLDDLDLLDAATAGTIRHLALDLFALGLPTHLRLSSGEHALLVSGIPPGEGGESATVVVFDESQRARSERVQCEFAINAAHELRTPLASIVTAVEMLQTGAKDDPSARDEFLEMIAREAGRLTRLTRALLVLARAALHEELPRSTPVKLAPLLEQVASTLPVHDGVSVTVDCPATLAVEGDPDLLEQALSSVSSNAAQHTEIGSVTLRGRRRNGSVTIEVADTGHGIPEGERERLFERFYRAGDSRASGFGLGLSIAREAVLALGGEIALDSEQEVGTTVRIVLPRTRGRT